MLERPRRLLHEWSTRRKNQQSIATLERHLLTRDPALLVHQMGRAGSMTTVRTLRSANLSMPIFHTHWLNPANVARRIEWVRDQPENRRPLNVRVSERIARAIEKDGIEQRDWHIVSVFREPIGRNLSVFFLSIETFIDGFFERHANGQLSDQEILDVFLERFPHDQPVTWFDEEIRDVFGLDVYSEPFSTEKGYQLLRKHNVSLLAIKVEDLNRCYRSAFEAFLECRIPELKQTHITEKNPSYWMYRDFIKDVKLPEAYLDRMYDTQFMQHFYGGKETRALRMKWGREQAAQDD